MDLVPPCCHAVWLLLPNAKSLCLVRVEGKMTFCVLQKMIYDTILKVYFKYVR